VRVIFSQTHCNPVDYGNHRNCRRVTDLGPWNDQSAVRMYTAHVEVYTRCARDLCHPHQGTILMRGNREAPVAQWRVDKSSCFSTITERPTVTSSVWHSDRARTARVPARRRRVPAHVVYTEWHKNGPLLKVYISYRVCDYREMRSGHQLNCSARYPEKDRYFERCLHHWKFNILCTSSIKL